MNADPNQEDTAAPASTGQLRMTESEIAEAREKIRGYLDAAKSEGIDLRPITGQTLRLASQAKLDLERLGSDIDEIDDDAYFDQIVQAGCLLAAPVEDVVPICMAGDLVTASVIWSLENLSSIAKEQALVRAFIARWLEYRVEMQILKQRPTDPAPDNGES